MTPPPCDQIEGIHRAAGCGLFDALKMKDFPIVEAPLANSPAAVGLSAEEKSSLLISWKTAHHADGFIEAQQCEPRVAHAAPPSALKGLRPPQSRKVGNFG
jgi:hypothetical protein